MAALGDPNEEGIELTMPRHISPVPFIDDEEELVLALLLVARVANHRKRQ